MITASRRSKSIKTFSLQLQSAKLEHKKQKIIVNGLIKRLNLVKRKLKSWRSEITDLQADLDYMEELAKNPEGTKKKKKEICF